MSNAANAITALQSILTFLNAVESGNLATGNVEIDNETLRLFAVQRNLMVQQVWNYGSRASQNATAAARAAVSGNVPAQDPVYKQIDDHIRELNAQIAVLQNPTSVPRRGHAPLK